MFMSGHFDVLSGGGQPLLY